MLLSTIPVNNAIKERTATFGERAGYSACYGSDRAPECDAQEASLSARAWLTGLGWAAVGVSGTIASITALSYLWTGVENRPTPIRESEAQRIRESIDHLDDAISQIRTVVFALSQREGSLRHRIIDVVAELCGTLTRPPAIRFSGPVDHAITGPLAEEVVGVTRELLSNAIRHAKADRMSVEVSVGEDSLTVVVTDDGIGVGEPGHRSGLRNLEERARACGGRLDVRPEAVGTRLHWQVPLS